MITPPSSSSLQASSRHRLRIVIPGYPAFNIYSRVARNTTALGPVCIATVVNKMPGWDVEIIDENNYRRHGPLADDGRPDHLALQALRPAHVVGFYGGLSSTVPRLYELAQIYKQMGVITIAGGQHFVGENIEEGLDHGVDVLLLGEAEDSVRECLPLLVGGGTGLHDIAGLAYRDAGRTIRTADRPPAEDLDAFPIPDYSLLRYAKLTLFPVGRVRGCGMDCEFCAVKGRARYASPERLLEQVMSAVERWDARNFFVVDDLFGQDREATLRLCRLLQEYQERIRHRLNLVVQIRLDKARDPELLRAMYAAGVRTVAIGFESPIPEELKAMNKHLNPDAMLEMTREFHRHGFLIHGMFIFGYPMQPGVEFHMSAGERVKCFRRFIRKARLDTVQVLLAGPLPGTEMTRRLREQNRLFSLKHVGWEYYDGNFPLFLPDPPLTTQEMQASITRIMGLFYRFKSMFSIGLHVLSFPMLLFHLHNLKAGWGKWYRRWRNSVIRFGGWLVLRRWLAQSRKSNFQDKREQAEQELTGHARLATDPATAGEQRPGSGS